jgi:hypothetical protein
LGGGIVVGQTQQPSANERSTALEALYADVGFVAAAHQPGALLWIEAERRSLRRLRAADVSTQDLERMLADAAAIGKDLVGANAVRVLWARHEFLLRGTREELAPRLQALASALSADRRTAGISWLVVATRIFPGEADRTLRCDPGYDLAGVTSSAAFWVEPFPGDDWTESQRYPITAMLWHPCDRALHLGGGEPGRLGRIGRLAADEPQHALLHRPFVAGNEPNIVSREIEQDAEPPERCPGVVSCRGESKSPSIVCWLADSGCQPAREDRGGASIAAAHGRFERRVVHRIW